MSWTVDVPTVCVTHLEICCSCLGWTWVWVLKCFDGGMSGLVDLELGRFTWRKMKSDGKERIEKDYAGK